MEESLSLVFFRSGVDKAKIEYSNQGKNFVIIRDRFNVRSGIIEPDAKEIKDSKDCGSNDNSHEPDLALAFTVVDLARDSEWYK